MSDRFKTFWLEPTGRVRRGLRCYISSGGESPKCSGVRGYHDAQKPFDTIAIEYSQEPEWKDRKVLRSYSPDDFPEADFPSVCDGCGQPLANLGQVTRQIFVEQLYRTADGREFTSRDAPPGAMYNADWLSDAPGYVGPDGIALCVKLPNGSDWMVDSEASNCTRPQRVAVEGKPECYRFVRTHYCWCRHGDPRTGEVHVDKNGNTCAAGAGSILSGNWHGFLHNGYLVS